MLLASLPYFCSCCSNAAMSAGPALLCSHCCAFIGSVHMTCIISFCTVKSISFDALLQPVYKVLYQSPAMQLVSCMDANMTLLCVCCCSKAARLIMIGFKMVGLPRAEETMNLAVEESGNYREWSQHQLLHRLGALELQWALHVASFKACYRQVSCAMGIDVRAHDDCHDSC